MDIQKRNNAVKVNTPEAGSYGSGTPTSAPEPAYSAPAPKKSGRKFAWKMWLLGFVVVALAGGGVYAWQQSTLGTKVSELQTENESLARAKNVAKEEAAKAAADLKTAQDAVSATTAATTASADFFEVKELGFKFKPGADLKDLVYFVSGDVAYFSTKSLMASAYKVNKGCNPSNAPLGVVTKVKAGAVIPAYNAPTTDKIETSKDAVKVGSFYILKQGPTTTCSDDKTTNDLETKQSSALKEALKSAVAI